MNTSCSGTITATFVWHPEYTGEPTPKSVIIHKDCFAEKVGNGPAPSSGLPNEMEDDGYAYGYRYWVKNNPGSTFDVLCSPSASASQSPEASVTYHAECSVVSVTLIGITTDGSQKRILIGQRCLGELSAVPWIPGLQISNHQWTVPGDIFGGFGVDSDNQSLSYHGYAIPVESLNQALPYWYWKRNAYINAVSCTATVSLNGISLGNIQGEQPIYVDKPQSNLLIFTLGDLVLSQGAFFGLFSGDIGSPYPGIIFDGFAKTPPPFYGSGGTIAYLQIISHTATYTDTNGVATTFTNQELAKGKSMTTEWYLGDRTGLDNGDILTIDDSPNSAVRNDAVRLSDAFSAKTYLMYVPPVLRVPGCLFGGLIGVTVVR